MRGGGGGEYDTFMEWRIQEFQKGGGGRKIPVRVAHHACAKRPIRVGSTGAVVGPLAGCRGRAPAGAQGRSPRKLSSFQQIRAFKSSGVIETVISPVEISRIRALVGGRGHGSHQYFRGS